MSGMAETTREMASRQRRANESIFSEIELMERLRATSIETGKAISDAFAKGVVAGKRFDQVLNDMGKKLSESLLKAALKPVELAISQTVNSSARALFGQLNPIGNGQTFANAMGSMVGVKPFADGGVISEPTLFGVGRNLGLMGERGAEAILPLARGPDGRLGVSAGQGAGGTGAANVTVNITAGDADSFRRSEGQVAAAIARAVARGQRGL